ncbi:MAG: T9SS type A sorting domain-containing protein, partial [Chitinophagales bacterium]
ADASIVSSQGDTVITVMFGNTTGSISVNAETPCGTQDTSLMVNVLTFAPIQNIIGDTLVCSGDTAVYSIGAVAGVNYSWTIPGDASILSSQGDTTITVLFGNDSGDITVVMESECNAHDTTLTVNVVAYPPIPVITFVNNDLISSAPTGNQWYYNGSPIAGATAQTYTPSLNGTYSVIVTYPPGCATASENFDVTTLGLLTIPSFIEVIVSPNPFETYATLQLANNYQLHNGKLLIQDIQGKVVVTLDHLNGNTIKIFREALPDGIYYFRLSDEIHKLMATGKLIIQ